MYFQIVDASGGGYFFRVKGGNHEIMANSEVYTTRASAQHAIDVIKGGAANAVVI
jgi:uncharacterized protein YegP (UPF0339 family)